MSEQSAAQPALHISVWFDVRCPWCFLGKRRLERALEAFAGTHPEIPVSVEHHSYELAPAIPDRFEGGEGEYLLRYEGMPLEQSARQLPALEALAQSEGVDLSFGHLQHGNTRRAHRVFQLGKQQGKGEELLEELFTGYFSEGRDMSNPNVLADIAGRVGLAGEEVREAADSEHWDAVIKRDHVRAEMLGSRGVPFMLINAKYAVPGAREPEVLIGAFDAVVNRDFGIERGGG